MLDRTYYILYARVLQEECHYNEMVETLKSAIELGPVLTQRERNLLQTAYDNAFKRKINSLNEAKRRFESQNEQENKPYFQYFIVHTENEIRNLYSDVRCLINHQLIPYAEPDDVEFYQKMIDSFNLYVIELIPKDDLISSTQFSIFDLFAKPDERLYSIWYALLAEKQQNYHEIAKQMKKVVVINAERKTILTDNEKRLFFSAHKNVLECGINFMLKWKERDELLKVIQDENIDDFMIIFKYMSLHKLRNFIYEFHDLIDVYILPMKQISELRSDYDKWKEEFHLCLYKAVSQHDLNLSLQELHDKMPIMNRDIYRHTFK